MAGINRIYRPLDHKPLKKTRIKLYNTLALPVLLYVSETWTVLKQGMPEE